MNASLLRTVFIFTFKTSTTIHRSLLLLKPHLLNRSCPWLIILNTIVGVFYNDSCSNVESISTRPRSCLVPIFSPSFLSRLNWAASVSIFVSVDSVQTICLIFNIFPSYKLKSGNSLARDQLNNCLLWLFQENRLSAFGRNWACLRVYV